MYSDDENLEASETNELIMGVLRELKDIKQTLADHTKILEELQASVHTMPNNFEAECQYFPISSFEDLEGVEEMMGVSATREYLTTQMRTMLTIGDTNWLSRLMNDELLEEFNTTGIHGKKNLLALQIIQTALKILRMDKGSVSFHLRRTKDKLQKRKRRLDESEKEEQPKRSKDKTSIAVKSVNSIPHDNDDEHDDM
ncbi:uncharacterized protein LOC132255852 [Phlebotomus argentipes]|uniref:uncharacterized protein LOC132255852 n=1 Tax=Phlebotomus argentipes TaxID=94469 RepID=UPI002892D4E8|nr:uncharacterized protein LOC132255852 [Phlebotomus argentipes]